MNRKVKSFKQAVFIGTMCGVESYDKCSKCTLSALTQTRSRFATSLLSWRVLYVVRSQPMQKFTVHVCDCVWSLPLLWKPRSWF